MGGNLSYPLPLHPPRGAAGNPQEPATLVLPVLVAVLPRGSLAQGQSCSQRGAAPVWRWELGPCWPVVHDISSNATEGLPDLHSPARTPFLPRGLFIKVLTGKRASQPSPGPAVCVWPGSRVRDTEIEPKNMDTVGPQRIPPDRVCQLLFFFFFFRPLGLFNIYFYFVVVSCTSHKIEHFFKGPVQGHSAHSQCHTNITTIYFQNFSVIPEPGAVYPAHV